MPNGLGGEILPATFLPKFARRNPVDRAEDATEVLHGGKARLFCDTGDFNIRILQQSAGRFQPALIEQLAERLSGRYLNARGYLIHV